MLTLSLMACDIVLIVIAFRFLLLSINVGVLETALVWLFLAFAAVNQILVLLDLRSSRRALPMRIVEFGIWLLWLPMILISGVMALHACNYL